MLPYFEQLLGGVVWLSVTFTPQGAKVKCRLKGEAVVRQAKGEDLDEAAGRILRGDSEEVVSRRKNRNKTKEEVG